MTATDTADQVDELRHRIEGGVKMLGAVAGVDVRGLLHDVQLLAVLALDAGDNLAVPTLNAEDRMANTPDIIAENILGFSRR